MTHSGSQSLRFDREVVHARILDPDGRSVEKPVEIRVHPLTGRTCRITFARGDEKERGAEAPPQPPPDADGRSACPFCRPRVFSLTPRFPRELVPGGRMQTGASVLFPNLYPYGRYSAVSLFDDTHFVEIGTADPASYADSLANCVAYLGRVEEADPAAVFTAITQNHLPSAGGSLVHPHFQVHADRRASNHHRFYGRRAAEHFDAAGELLFSAYLAREAAAGERVIGRTGEWHWMAAFAPEGFYEIWGILPGVCTLQGLTRHRRDELARGILNVQRFYRSLNRNGYNLGLLAVERRESRLELRVVMLARSNYAPWVRSDHTGYEVMLGETATFTSPESTARLARPFWR